MRAEPHAPKTNADKVSDSQEVTVLLSTYNGAKFLRSQLDSILAQTHSKLAIHVRDDGSTDATLQILRQYSRSYPSISVIDYGGHVGVVRSYFTLLQAASNDSDYFAFADQDDLWPPTKIENAVVILETHDRTKPLLYCSAVEYVDTRLQHLGYSKQPRRLGFGNALVQNVAVGATILINSTARSIVVPKVPKRALMHDWWLYLVISAHGEVIYDPEPSLRYRQHAANVVGWPRSFNQQVLRPLAYFIRLHHPTIRDQAIEFLRCYGSELSKQHHGTLISFLAAKRSLWSSAKYAVRMGVWRQSVIEDLKLRAMIISGRY
jgi:glycosyltransferase involved in cell wall biosynthesis